MKSLVNNKFSKSFKTKIMSGISDAYWELESYRANRRDSAAESALSALRQISDRIEWIRDQLNTCQPNDE